LTPSQRYDQLQALVESIRNTPKALEEITRWGLELDKTITTVKKSHFSIYRFLDFGRK
jgi:hypothetical protein